jgi:hypothetical protein
MPKLVRLPPKDWDKDLANEIRAKIDELAALMDKANDRGLVVGFSININPATGKNVGTSSIQIVKNI